MGLQAAYIKRLKQEDDARAVIGRRQQEEFAAAEVIGSILSSVAPECPRQAAKQARADQAWEALRAADIRAQSESWKHKLKVMRAMCERVLSVSWR